MLNHLIIRRWASALLCLGVLPAVPGPARAADSKAYVINEIQVTDPAKYKDYAEQVPATLKPFGGVFIVRGGRTDVLSGAAPTAAWPFLNSPTSPAPRRGTSRRNIRGFFRCAPLRQPRASISWRELLPDPLLSGFPMQATQTRVHSLGASRLDVGIVQ